MTPVVGAEGAGGLEDAVEFDAAGTHEFDVGLGGFVAVFEGKQAQGKPFDPFDKLRVFDWAANLAKIFERRKTLQDCSTDVSGTLVILACGIVQEG